MENKFAGTGVALVTPFKENLEIDYASLGQLLKHVSQGGVEYLVVMGTTGESATLSAEEKKEVLSFVKKTILPDYLSSMAWEATIPKNFWNR
jgi:4-hydroxy-tetrahydrodipicolinate synthase